MSELLIKTATKKALEEASTLYDNTEAKPLVVILRETRDRLPSTLTASGNLRVALVEDGIGVAKEPARGTVSHDIAAGSVAAGSSVDVKKTGLNGWAALAVTVRVTYDPTATAGVRVLWLYSPDDINYDSEEDAVAQGNYYDLSFAAGATRQATILVALLMPYVTIRIKNLDTAVAATVDVWTVPLR